MKKFFLLMAASFLAAPAFALPDYESFSDATASGGTSYTTGDPLAGQTDAGGQSWFAAGTGTVQPTVAAGDLTVSGLYSTGGGQSAAFGGNGNNARLNLSVGPGGITTSTVYYSLAINLNDLTVLNPTGTFLFGMNNAQGTQTTTPNTVVTRLEVRSAGTGLYNIGLDKSSGVAGSIVWDTGTYDTSDTIFLVGSYTFNTGTGTDDQSQLWINPAASSFGAATAPAATLSSTAGTDIARVASLVLYDRSANEPAGTLDEVRAGQSWADVTPAVPEPGTLAIGALGLAGLCGLRFFRKA